MASSGTDGADGEKARPPQPSLRPEEVDSGWSDTPKPPEAAKESDPTAHADAGAPRPEEPPSAEPPAPTAETPPEPDPPEPPVRAPEAVVPPERPLAPPPAEASPPAVSEPHVEPSPPPPPVASAPRAAPPVWAPAEPFRKRAGLASLLGEPPTKGWFFVGGVAMIASLFVGILIGRGLGEPSERSAVASASPPREAARPAVPAPSPPPSSEPAMSAEPPPAPKPSGAVVRSAPRPFNAQAAKLAIDRIVPKLKACKQSGEPPGTATVSVTFAPTGRVSNAAVTTTRYAGTRTGNCIAQRLREARVPEFTGKPVTVKRGIAIK